MPIIEEHPFVSIIIPVFNDNDALAQCLNALKAQSYPIDRFEIIIIDNGSEKQISDSCFDYDNVSVINESYPSSYAARNRGIEHARGEVIGFTDADCIPNNNWISAGIDVLRNTSNCGLVAGHIDIFPGDPQNPTAVELYDSIFAFPQEHFVNDLHFGVTANLFTTKRSFEEVGTFDRTLQSGGDIEWGNRVYASGRAIVFAKDVIVMHPGRKRFADIRAKHARDLAGLHLLYKRDPHAWPIPIRGNLLRRSLLFVSDIARIISCERTNTIGTISKTLVCFFYFKWIHYSELMRLKAGGAYHGWRNTGFQDREV